MCWVCGRLSQASSAQLGDLAWAAGQVPTPHGLIAVRVEKAALGLIVQVTLPEGVAAELRLVADEASLPIVTGANAKCERMGHEFVIALPPGAKATIASAR